MTNASKMSVSHGTPVLMAFEMEAYSAPSFLRMNAITTRMTTTTAVEPKRVKNALAVPSGKKLGMNKKTNKATKNAHSCFWRAVNSTVPKSTLAALSGETSTRNRNLHSNQ